MHRRNLIKNFLKFSGSFLLISIASGFTKTKANKQKLPLFNNKSNKTMIQLPSLPYEKNALMPYISENTINYHYGKHHQTYVNNLNNLIKDTELSSKNLEEIVKISANDSSKVAIFNNAAQIWNHTFYWNSMKPNGGGVPNASLLAKIESDFGSYENFVNEFKNSAISQFGSGWSWVVLDEKDKLKILKTGNAETPLTNPKLKPLLTIDVWEHAYYLDFQNARANYVDIFLNHLINWDFINQNLIK